MVWILNNSIMLKQLTSQKIGLITIDIFKSEGPILGIERTIELHHDGIIDAMGFEQTTIARIGHESGTIQFNLKTLKVLRKKFHFPETFEGFIYYLTLWCLFKVEFKNGKQRRVLTDEEADLECVKYFKSRGWSLQGITKGLDAMAGFNAAARQNLIDRLIKINTAL